MHLGLNPDQSVPGLLYSQFNNATTQQATPTGIITDPVKLLSPVIQIYLPVGFTEINTMIGLWFDTVGMLTVYVQQAIAPDNVYVQVKILRFRLPVALGFTIFTLGFGMFLVRSSILAVRLSAAEVTAQIQKLLEQLMQKIKNGQLS